MTFCVTDVFSVDAGKIIRDKNRIWLNDCFNVVTSEVEWLFCVMDVFSVDAGKLIMDKKSDLTQHQKLKCA